MKKKRMLALLLTVAMAGTMLAGCGRSDGKEDEKGKNQAKSEGKVYYLNISVSKEGTTTVEISSSVAWGNSDTVSVPGNSTDVNPSPGQPGWEAGDGDTDMSGESSEVNLSPSEPEWGSGESEEMPGTSSGVNPSPEAPGWTPEQPVELPGTTNNNEFTGN